jgi:hypothetical protein
MFEPVKILIREIDPARAAMLFELGKCDQQELGGSADFTILTFAIMRDQFVKEYLSLFQWCHNKPITWLLLKKLSRVLVIYNRFDGRSNVLANLAAFLPPSANKQGIPTPQ